MDKQIDYNKLGLKIGLEIHQQLDSKKLFCECPSVLRSNEPDKTIYRKLHAVAGEQGKIDEAAKYHALMKKEFIYQAYDTTCLVELDEEPPHKINKEALSIALQIAILLNAKILPLTQIMRKTVINGSNTSGFQRTALIAKDGFVETKCGKIAIEGIFLEEDAARIIEKTDDKIVYRLDRLGIPLVEISTYPNIKTPEQAKEVALYIGDILRSCKVKRGIGTIRQDVNMSIKKGARIEIKGVQEPELIIKTIISEIKRQKNLIKNKKIVRSEVRNALPDGNTEFLRPMPGAARMYPETDLPLLKISKNLIDEIKKNLPKLKSEIKKELRGTGLNNETAELLLKQNKLEEFKELMVIIKNPNLIVKMILLWPKEILSHEKIGKEKIEKRLNRDAMALILEKLKEGEISENQIKEIMKRIANGTRPQDAVLFKKTDINKIEEKILKMINEKPGLSEKAYMGLIMNEFKGQITGKEAMEIIRKLMKR